MKKSYTTPDIYSIITMNYGDEVLLQSLNGESEGEGGEIDFGDFNS